MKKYADFNSQEGPGPIPPYVELPLGDKLLVMLSKISHLSRAAFDGRTSQTRVLHLLKEEGAMTQRELTEHLGIQSGSASELMKKLESAGLISRTVSKTDRRAIDVCLTEEGDSLAEEYLHQRAARIHEMFSCLSPDEQMQMLSFMERLDQSWSARYRGDTRRKANRDRQEI